MPKASLNHSEKEIFYNPKLKSNLVKYDGEKLLLLQDMYISDLLGKNDVAMKDTSKYKVTDSDLDILEKPIMKALKKKCTVETKYPPTSAPV